jgi:bacillopeptidase F (M6 metalloprotease family)
LQSFLADDIVSPSSHRPEAPVSGQVTRGGSRYVYSQRADVRYQRLMNTFAVPSGDADLSFFTSYDTEPEWDFLFVEAHTVGQDDWVTLPVADITGNSTGQSCPEGWFELHPWVERYQGADCSGGGWNATSGRSAGWEEWTVDLSAWEGQQVEVSISYAQDWATQGLRRVDRRHRCPRFDRGH